MNTISYSEQIPVASSHDVIVAGGGVAGVAAALSARRTGQTVLLIEKGVNLGGLATTGLINYFEPLCDGAGHIVIGGLCEELLHLAIRYGYDTLPDEWREGEPGESCRSRYVTHYSHTIFPLVLTELLQDEGVELLLDTVISAPVMDDRHCLGLITDGKSGRQFHEAGVVIDATGDADVLFRAGMPTVQGKNYFTYSALAIDLESCRRAAESGDIRDAYYSVNGGKASLYGDNQPADERFYLGTSNEDVTEYIVRNQRILLDSIKNQPRFSRDIVTLPGMAQLRTTRRLDGDYTLTTDDMGHYVEDSIGTVCDFDKPYDLYEIPRRCLVRTGYDNLITCGRSVSAAGYAWDVTRVIPPAILTGQAAGLLAASALEERRPAAGVSLQRLQFRLLREGIMIHMPR